MVTSYLLHQDTVLKALDNQPMLQWQICHYSTKEIREGTQYINGPVSCFHEEQSIAGTLNQPITPNGHNLIYKYHAGATVRINHDGEIVSKNHSKHTNGFL